MALSPRWQHIFLWGGFIALLVIAFGMRLYNLGQPFDHDGYDEGVYWQSLLAMHAGYALYQQIFYSQPPFFLLSTYSIFSLFGGTLWSARLGIALVSLLGFPGAFMMGKAVSGRLGAIAATLLLVIDPLYFSLSQKIEAEVSSAAFSFLAVGAAYLWWENPEGTGGLYFAALSGITLALGILCKLLSLTSVAPIAILILARLWQIWQKQPGASVKSLRSIAVIIGASLLTMVVVLLPFLGSFTQTLRDVVMFHTDARNILINNRVQNNGMIQSFAQSNPLLLIAATYGLVAALLRRDWRVIPLVAWALLSLYLLWEEVPLFPRHFIVLIPPLIAIAVMGLGGTSSFKGLFSRFQLPQMMTAVAIMLMLVIIVRDIPQYPPYYQQVEKQGSDAFARLEARVASDLRNSIAPNQFVITDGQFVASLAGRDTPPDLVDTSLVRIASGYVTYQQVINEAEQPQVRAVLFFTGRLNQPQLKPFYTWVTNAQHFRLKFDYGQGRQLWIKINS